MSEPIVVQLHLTLSSESDVILDLREGFSGKPQVTFSNEGADTIRHSCLFHAELERNNDRDDAYNEILDLDEALRDGDMIITDERGYEILMEQVNPDEMSSSGYGLVSEQPGHSDWTYGFKRISPTLLDQLGRHLVPGGSYHIAFAGRPRAIECEVGEESPETPESVEALLEPSWDPQTIPFTVVAGTRKPRFTMSVTARSSVCHVSAGKPAFHIAMVVTSLERRPVTVNTQLHDFVDMWPENPAWRWETWGSHDVFSLRRDHDGLECVLDAQHPPERALRPASDFRPENGLLEFHHGTTHTYHFHLGQQNLCPNDEAPFIHHAPYAHDELYVLRTRLQGFSAWDYGTKAELSQTHRKPSDWCKHAGPILFEPVCDAALTVRAIMERETPMPFSRLPPEIREVVYTYLRYGSNAGKIWFTADRDQKES